MATPIDDLKNAAPIKITDGSTETNTANVTATENLQVADILDEGGTQGAITVGTTAIAARVGGSNLANRKCLTVWNNGTATIYWGYTNAVTTSTGTPLMRNQQLFIAAGPNTTIWLIAASGSHNVRITEGA